MNVSVPSDVKPVENSVSSLGCQASRRLSFDIREGVIKYRYQVGFNEVPF